MGSSGIWSIPDARTQVADGGSFKERLVGLVLSGVTCLTQAIHWASARLAGGTLVVGLVGLTCKRDRIDVLGLKPGLHTGRIVSRFVLVSVRVILCVASWEGGAGLARSASRSEGQHIETK